MSDDDLTARRVEQLENAVRALRDEMAELRAELRSGARAAPAPLSALGPRLSATADQAQLDESRVRAGDSREPTAESREPVIRGPDRRRAGFEPKDLEALIGRYGTLALGALTILMAVGAFLGWAITNDLIRVTPGMRVALGFVAAGAIAALGWRMRTRASKRFGHTLLALALAVVHVDAWGAGPYLGLFPQAVALGIAALASAALAALALREDEESLFAVGFGGALVAPFVTSTGRGDVIALLAYGLVVVALGLVVLRGRTWNVGARIAGVAGTAYAFAGVAADREVAGVAVHLAPMAFTLALAWLAAVVAGDRHRLPLARVFLALGVIVLAASNDWGVGNAAWMAFGAAGMLSVYALSALGSRQGTTEGREPRAESLVMTLLLPLGYLLVTLVKAEPDLETTGAALAAGWALAALAMTWRDPAERREEHVTTALLASALAIALALREHQALMFAALAAHGAVSSVLLRRLRDPLLLLPALGVLVPVALGTLAELHDRPAYAYTPFGGAMSLAALAVSAAWLTLSWHASRVAWPERAPDVLARPALVRGAGAVVAFLWVREELAHFGSPDQATFALIAYYALAGVAAIWIGRLRTFPDLRRLGLALALFAAGKAVVQASGLASIGFKVGSYVVVGGFLLAVAYWYRASGEVGAA